jgi:hypothetical protein
VPEETTAEIAAATATLMTDHDVVGTVIEVIGRCVRVIGAFSAGVVLADPDSDTMDFLAATRRRTCVECRHP